MRGSSLGAAGWAGGFPSPPPPGSGMGGRLRAARGGGRGTTTTRGWVLRGAGVPGACLCVLDCKGKWLTAPALPLLPFPSYLGPSGRMESPGAAGSPRIRTQGPSRRRGRETPGSEARSLEDWLPLSSVSFTLTPNAITEVE